MFYSIALPGTMLTRFGAYVYMRNQESMTMQTNLPKSGLTQNVVKLVCPPLHPFSREIGLEFDNAGTTLMLRF